MTPAAAVIATFVMILAAAYLLWMVQRVLFGEVSEFIRGLGHHLTDMTPVEILTLAPLGILVVVFGLFPGLILGPIEQPIALALRNIGTTGPAVVPNAVVVTAAVLVGLVIVLRLWAIYSPRETAAEPVP